MARWPFSSSRSLSFLAPLAAKPTHGTVCLVVPLSVSFARQKSELREAFDAACCRIAVRHQDNTPDSTFGHSPVVQKRNRQRATIILAVKGPPAQH